MTKTLAAVMDKITAPWSVKQVAALNAMQEDDRSHGYTCPGEHPVCANHRKLIATKAGWVCQCGAYRQDWAVITTNL